MHAETQTRAETQSAPLTLVIFGITGDLAHRKLLPAVYHLAKKNLLPEQLRIVGVTRGSVTVSTLAAHIRESVEASGEKCDQNILDSLAGMIETVTMDLTHPAEYKRLRRRLEEIEDEAKVCMNRLFYLAIPAQMFGPVVEHLGIGGLHETCRHGTGFSRLLIEKPFGYDLQSAEDLIKKINRHFSEEQVYRIDHYLAKETTQNILNFRFQNPIFRKVWGGHCISRIMITAAEKIDIEGRTVFYEQTGALRDFVQSHLLQLLALITMEEPRALTADEIHRQKLRLLKDITPIAPDRVASETVRGQYQGYREEVQNHDSLVETYAALRLHIDNNHWKGVPILLRTGKALAEKVGEVTIVFSDSDKLTKDNVLTIRIQPNEGISLRLLAKKPGLAETVEPVDMAFEYKTSFPGMGEPDAYERVLTDAFRGDKTLFATSEEVLTNWRIIENVLSEWAKNDHGLEQYAKGSWGPLAAEALAKESGKLWPEETAVHKKTRKS